MFKMGIPLLQVLPAIFCKIPYFVYEYEPKEKFSSPTSYNLFKAFESQIIWTIGFHGNWPYSGVALTARH